MGTQLTHLRERLVASTFSKTRFTACTGTVLITLVIGTVLAFVLPAEHAVTFTGSHSDITRSHALSPGVIGTLAPSTKNLYCLMYEKNHRTGSTTVRKYLDKCFANRPGIEQCDVKPDSTGHWTRCLQEKKSNVSVMYSSKHLRLDDNDMISIMVNCAELAVIRTSRPASERRFSRFKYNSCNHRSCIGRNLDFSNLTNPERDSFWDWEQPYYSALRFQPTRILENNNLDQELGVLGKELGCDITVKPANVHESTASVGDAVRKVVIGEVYRHNMFIKGWLTTKKVKLWRKLRYRRV